MGFLQPWGIHLVRGLAFALMGGQHSTFSLSVNCASVHRKIGTHVSKVYVAAVAGDACVFTQTRNFQEEPDNGCLDKGAG